MSIGLTSLCILFCDSWRYSGMRGVKRTYYRVNPTAKKRAFSFLEDTDFQYMYSCANSVVFTGKEKDSETGYYYFGARYYDSDLSGLFLSVDPMSDKYPNISPYAYCAWNPVKLVDPEGGEMWKPEILEDGTVNYVMEKGDNAKTLQEQYNLSENAATKLFATMKDGKISGESAKAVTGSEVLKLRVKGSSDSRFLYHLGFSLMYNREKQKCRNIKLNDFFSGMPQELGNNSHWGTPKFLDDFNRALMGRKNETFSIPVKGGKEIPVTFFDATVSGKSVLIRDCYGIQEKKTGYLNFRMNRYGPKTGCNGAQAIIIQVQNKYEDAFVESYDCR